LGSLQKSCEAKKLEKKEDWEGLDKKYVQFTAKAFQVLGEHGAYNQLAYLLI
jgi:hypothetical protein